ncbi:MAG: uncharacterized protein KVP18_003069 [Porospora cf. gigantea A]|uniref:uncharacterized protein n=1 Tax=Porospora cf. gigantea A TaxID=2853593 RepID=UPI003559CD46|nr:MAG: hypothetical protein KVP18_003069 [Porospora cf. gigantea A]
MWHLFPCCQPTQLAALVVQWGEETEIRMVDVERVLAHSPRSMRLTAAMFEPGSNSPRVKPSSTRGDIIIEGSPPIKPQAEVFSSPLDSLTTPKLTAADDSLTTPKLTAAEEQPFSGDTVVDEKPPCIYHLPADVGDVSMESPGPPIVNAPFPTSSVTKGSVHSIRTLSPTLSDRSITKSIPVDNSAAMSPLKRSTEKAPPAEASTGKMTPAPTEGSAGIATPAGSEAPLMGLLPEISTQAQTPCSHEKTVTLPVRRRRARLILPTRLSFRRSPREVSESSADRPIHTKSSTASWSKIKTVCFNEDVKSISVTNSNQAPMCAERILRPQFSRSSRVSFIEDSLPPPPPPASQKTAAATLQRPLRSKLQQDRTRTRRF